MISITVTVQSIIILLSCYQLFSVTKYVESVLVSSVLGDTPRWHIAPVAIGQTPPGAHTDQLETVVALVACSTPNSSAFSKHAPIPGVRQALAVNTCMIKDHTRGILGNFSHLVHIRLQTGSDPDHCPVGRQTLFEFPLRK